MIRALLTATGAVWWACAGGILAACLIGRLGAFWRERRASSRCCRYCLAPLTAENQYQWHPWHMTEWRAHLCGACVSAWLRRHDRLPREVMG